MVHQLLATTRNERVYRAFLKDFFISLFCVRVEIPDQQPFDTHVTALSGISKKLQG